MKISEKIKKIIPVGYDIRQEKAVFILGMAFSFFCSLWYYWLRLSNYVGQLYYINGSEKILKPDAFMYPFHIILGNSLLPFIILFFVMLFYGIVHYEYHKMGSRSIYLMKRLPQKGEFMKRCWTLPILTSAFVVFTFFLLLIFFYGLYIYLTPEGLVPRF